MKVVAFNGSPRKNGNTYHALKTVCQVLEQNGIETEIVQVGGKLKTTVTIPTDSEQDAVLAVVTADSKIQKLMEGKDLVKVIHVPNKLMNLILKPKA